MPSQWGLRKSPRYHSISFQTVYKEVPLRRAAGPAEGGVLGFPDASCRETLTLPFRAAAKDICTSFVA